MMNLNKYYTHLKSLKLDLGSGLYPKEGFVGIDNFIGIKAQTLDPESIDKSKLNVVNHDLQKGIPFDSDSIDEVVASHFLEHVTYLDKLLEEVHRVLKDGCKFEIIVPYANSAEGMYPGHNIFFTEKWFLNNLQFNNFLEIKQIIFYESEYYHEYKDKLNKFFTFDEARLFLFNVCWQMQIISFCKKKNKLIDNILTKIEYKIVPYEDILNLVEL